MSVMFADFAMLTASIIWGSTFIIIKKSLAGVNAVTFVCYRFMLAAMVMGVLLLFLRKKFWQHLSSGMILGLLLFTCYLTQTLALHFMSVASGGFIAGLFVIFVPIFSFICRREKLRLNVIIAVILAGAGLWSITRGIKDLGWGDCLMLLSAVAFAIHILYVDTVVKKCDIWVLNFQQFSVVALLGLFGILLFRLPWIISGWSIAWGIVYLALFANVLCYAIQLGVQRIVSPTVCALILSLEPVFAAIFAWTIGGEKIIMADVYGGVMIIVAIIIAQLS